MATAPPPSSERAPSPLPLQRKHTTNQSCSRNCSATNSRSGNGSGNGSNSGSVNRKNSGNGNGCDSGGINGRNSGSSIGHIGGDSSRNGHRNDSGNGNGKNNGISRNGSSKGGSNGADSRNDYGNPDGNGNDVKNLIPAMAPASTISFSASPYSSSSSCTSSSSVSSLVNSHSSKGGLPRPCPSLPQQEIVLHTSSSINSFNSLGSSSPSIVTDHCELMKRMALANQENVTVTVRFRPLSSREVRKGDEVAWYADGDTMVRNEYNAATVYAFDKVFGPATTTRHVYDVAAQHVVGSAMKGVNGTVFAYGVSGSGKTHTMFGDQKSPGIIPLAVKDVFSIIEETPWREFFLRVSYLEIYNEVINDLLDPAGQNLRICEDVQGTYVEGIKEHVVLSSAHCLSLIAAGEEHRHIGSNNFNLLSSRSHTILTLTIESGPRGDNINHEVSLSHLNLIDLAGSEGSQTDNTSHLEKEGSYINKSLLTLGTVLSKLTDGKATHIPYGHSKLTRLLQSSLSGRGRISLICTITPASTSNEETHNTLKFAYRTKHVKIHPSQNKIMDNKSLIKKYQKEILSLKLELEHVKEGMTNRALLMGKPEDHVSFKQQLAVSQDKLQSRLKEVVVVDKGEEEAETALLGRIQRLTKLILVSSKNMIPQSLPGVENQRRHSFGEDELIYLPDRRRDRMCDEEIHDLGSSLYGKNVDIISNEGEKKAKKRSVLAWFKIKQRNELGAPTMRLESDNYSNMSPATNGPCTVHAEPAIDFKGQQNSTSLKGDHGGSIDLISETTQTGTTKDNQAEILKEQIKLLAEELTSCSGSLKTLSEQVIMNPGDYELQLQLKKCKDEIQEKKKHMYVLEQQIGGGAEAASHSNSCPINNSQAIDIEQLRQENNHLHEEKDALQVKMSQMAEELSYAKELASAAGVELKNLSEEITKLSYHNTKLAAELTNAKGSAYARPKSKSVPRQRANAVIARKLEGAVAEELKRELLASKEKEVALEGRLAQRDRKDAEMQQKLEDMKRREADLEKELANARLVLANIKHEASEDGAICLGYRELLEFQGQSGATEDAGSKNVGALMEALANERSHTAELETLISQLKSENLNGLNIAALEDLSALHIEALTRLCHVKRAMMQEKIKERGDIPVTAKDHPQENGSNTCKVCLSAAPAAVLLPCRHFSLCKSCAVACAKCPLCKATIKDRIITYTS